MAKARKALEKASDGPAGRKFPVAKLRDGCRKLFGVSASTFDGATLGMRGEYTVEEMRAHIEEWGNMKGVD